MRKLLLPLAALALLAACAAPVPPVSPNPTSAPANIAAVVEGFGQRLQLVSLLAPDAAAQIRSQYADFVAPELLDAWAADPESAPGRLTSSPWPDHIDVASLSIQANGSYAVEGAVVEMTSTGEAGRLPVVIVVDEIGGRWLITAYTAGNYP